MLWKITDTFIITSRCQYFSHNPLKPKNRRPFSPARLILRNSVFINNSRTFVLNSIKKHFVEIYIKVLLSHSNLMGLLSKMSIFLKIYSRISGKTIIQHIFGGTEPLQHNFVFGDKFYLLFCQNVSAIMLCGLEVIDWSFSVSDTHLQTFAGTQQQMQKQTDTYKDIATLRLN